MRSGRSGSVAPMPVSLRMSMAGDQIQHSPVRLIAHRTTPRDIEVHLGYPPAPVGAAPCLSADRRFQDDRGARRHPSAACLRQIRALHIRGGFRRGLDKICPITDSGVNLFAYPRISLVNHHSIVKVARNLFALYHHPAP